MTIRQFVDAVHAAWANDPFLGAVAIRDIRCSVYAGTIHYYVRLVDHSTVTVYITEEGKIVFF